MLHTFLTCFVACIRMNVCSDWKGSAESEAQRLNTGANHTGTKCPQSFFCQLFIFLDPYNYICLCFVRSSHFDINSKNEDDLAYASH